MGLSVIIPSRTPSNLFPCLRAVGEHDPGLRRIVIDDGIGLPWPADDAPYEHVIQGISPFVFSRAVNQGIVAAGDDDICACNDDALLQTDRGFSAMQSVAQQHPEFGVIAGVTNYVGNPNQHPRGVGLREDPRMVCFVCVLIPRRTIDLIGLLDERFGGTLPDGRQIYGWEDDDYCRRVRNAGLKIGIFDGCFVDHRRLKSTFRPGNGGGDIEPGRQIFIQKWGTDELSA